MISHRSLLLRALLLDCLGQMLIVISMISTPELTGHPIGVSALETKLGWILFMVLVYPASGWLFGSFTVLRWRRLPFTVLLQRLLLTSVATLIVVATVRWLFNPYDDVWIVYRKVQIFWMVGITIWSFLVRVGLRRGVLSKELPRLFLLAKTHEIDPITRAWNRVPGRQKLRSIKPSSLLKLFQFPKESVLVAITAESRKEPELSSLLYIAETIDPSQIRLLSVIHLFEKEQERLPPNLLSDESLCYEELPWSNEFSFQAKLKRLADFGLSALLLLITSPLIVVAAFLMWFEDRGPLFYTQERSGWLGRTFRVIKLRTMIVHPDESSPTWTVPGDHRITKVGYWLRRFRIDELPQLINVLKGEMSLIGPRPERPEVEKILESHIQHYRKRHWVLPGLSGWAQVSAPYASSVDDSDLKLSYDLYYLRHFSTWLDFIILFRTIKTVLKAVGR